MRISVAKFYFVKERSFVMNRLTKKNNYDTMEPIQVVFSNIAGEKPNYGQYLYAVRYHMVRSPYFARSVKN